MKSLSKNAKKLVLLQKLVNAAVERYSIEEIICALKETKNDEEIRDAVELIFPDEMLLPKDTLVIETKFMAMDKKDKLNEFLCSAIYPYANEQENIRGLIELQF